MLVSSAEKAEIQLTLEIALSNVNELETPDLDARQILTDSGFSRASDAPEAAIKRFMQRLRKLAPLITKLPDLETTVASAMVNTELTTLPIAPAIVDHGGIGPHMHWTPVSASFDDQVVADMLMAIAQELCANGTIRFGRCAAVDCDDLFYDGTRNRSRRFCADPRCASRTHTADHRARSKGSDG